MPKGVYNRGLFSERRLQIGSESEVFWRRVNKDGPIHPILQTKCWLWIASLYKKTNYGQFRQERAHRVVYRLTYGTIPEGLFVCHHCDNPSCVNPEHLFLGTAQDNMDDKMKKGRKGDSGTKTPPIGEKNNKAKLTEKQVLRIRKDLEDGDTIKYLANKYGVHKTTISYIKNRKTWRHI